LPSDEILQSAIRAARAGQKEAARDLLLSLVEAEPRNELAWIWLSGLVDSLEDRIVACENALTINPANERIRNYLSKLQQRRGASLRVGNRADAASLLSQAKAHEERNEMDAALGFARQALAQDDAMEGAWLLVGRNSADIDQQIAALERAHALNPANRETLSALRRTRYLKAHPASLARRLEQFGKFEAALKLYEELAAKAKSSREFDEIYREIVRLEGLKNENIRYVAPETSIARLTFAWPSLYLSLALVQMGLNPFAHAAPYLWLGLPFVSLGSFLLSLVEVRPRDFLWQGLFSERRDRSDLARLVAAACGWFLVLAPHILIVLDSLNRLGNFVTPPIPF
jgi:tetratricopeptide (TPR) repeat protein